MFIETLNRLMEERGINKNVLAKESGIPYTTIDGFYKKGTENIKLSTLTRLCDYFGVLLDTFVAEDYSKNEEIQGGIQKILSSLPLYSLPVSAGTGEWIMDGYEYEFVEFEDAPKGASFALKVRGDSMEPMYSDGDIVFVKPHVILESWQAGVFYLNGDGYLKMQRGNQLISCNPKYPPVFIREDDEFTCFGRVIGKVTSQTEDIL